MYLVKSVKIFLNCYLIVHHFHFYWGTMVPFFLFHVAFSDLISFFFAVVTLLK